VRQFLRWSVPAYIALVCACGADPEPVPDAGVVDAGIDAGFPDAAIPDAGPARVTLQLDFDGDGEGRVSLGASGLQCNDDCTFDFEPGTRLTLTATAADTMFFEGWTTPGCGTERTCVVTLDQDLRMAVRFIRFYSVSIDPVGDGLGVIDFEGGTRCIGACEVPVLSGAMLTLQAVPAAGVEFAGWAGACSGPDPECRLGINTNKIVRASFAVKRPQIDGGDGHFCVVLQPGVLRCWGQGDQGQLGWGNDDNLGDDERIDEQGNLQVGVDVIQVDVGGAHSCVLAQDGGIRCWGANTHGQLGQGHRRSVGGLGDSSPSELTNIALGGPALQVAAGGNHTCALMANGEVRCWGQGAQGQLGYGAIDDVGDGAGVSPLEAGPVDLGAAAIYVASGLSHTCAVLEGGDVKCWGDNAKGQLGYRFAGNAGDGTTGRAVPSELDILALSAPVRSLQLSAEHSCARFEDRRVRCWGSNTHGQLGDGDTQQVGGAAGIDLATGIDVLLGLDRVVDVTVGLQHTCASLQNGEIRCWGAGAAGAIGSEAVADELSPLAGIPLIAGHRPVRLTAAGRTTCTATRFGGGPRDIAVLCWGDGRNGGLASGSTSNVGDRPGTMPPEISSVF
jgi:alpha-tubulin suppressor-like RCC1 family protein